MTRDEMLEFVRRNTTSFMATVEGDMPRVRAMDTPHVDGSGLTFCTGTGKDVCRQLLANADVELCYWSPEDRLQLRIRGRMEVLDSDELKKRIVESKFTFFKPVVQRHGWGSLTLFLLSKGTARTWSPESPAELNPPVYDF